MCNLTPPTRRRVPSGFSLIEMLIVISIIALLIGLAGFAWSKMKTQTKADTAVSLLQRVSSMATEYQAQTDTVVNVKTNKPINWTSNGTSGMGNVANRDAHASIERFVWAMQQIPRTKKMLNGFGDNLRDTDGDGFAEIVDPWGTPLVYRAQVLTDTDFVPRHHRPYFASAGPDREFGDATAGGGPNASPDADAKDNLYSFNLQEK